MSGSNRDKALSIPLHVLLAVLDNSHAVRHNRIIERPRQEDAIAYRDDKLTALQAAHAVNPRPHMVTDTTFVAGQPFFDARDRVQVKYEMLRRVHVEGYSVTQAAAAFGFSRPAFYATQAAWRRAGLPGLLSARPGPRSAHKLTPEVVDFLRDARLQDPTLRAPHLARLVREHCDVRVHPRSIERALARSARVTAPTRQ